MSFAGHQISLEISGLGIIFYSPEFARHIAEGEDYFSSRYSTEEQVQSHIQDGSIVGFGTGSPGRYVLRFFRGYPDQTLLDSCDSKLRLGLHCVGGIVFFRDLYDLMQWRSDCPEENRLHLEDGFYHITLCTNRPESGILGDDQEVSVFLQKLDALPALRREGIPTLCYR
jgi:hypothetical protein